MKREPAEPQGSIKPTGVGIPRLQAGEEVNNCPQHLTDAFDGKKKVCPDCECELEKDLNQRVFTAPATIDEMIATLRFARGTLGGDTPIVLAYYGDMEGFLQEFEVRNDYAIDGELDRHRCYLKDAEAGDRRVLALMI